MAKITKSFIGVDVSKDFLDICLLSNKEKHLRVKNNEIDIKNFLQKLSRSTIERLVCEASGGYEDLIIRCASKSGYAIWRVEPKRIKAFIASEGIKAKTDKIDAKMIALFAQQKNLPKYMRSQLLHDHEEKLKNLVRRKEVLTRMVAQEKTRLKHPQERFCQDDIKNHIAYIEQQIKKLTKEIDTIIKNHYQQKAQIITSIPGLGSTTIASLLAHVPELGSIENKRAAAIVGLVPYTCQSGNSKRSAHIKEGRPAPRKVLYMAALTAIQYNQDMKLFYQRLVQAGKNKKVALVAVMRKIIVLVNLLIFQNRSWRPLNA